MAVDNIHCCHFLLLYSYSLNKKRITFYSGSSLKGCKLHHFANLVTKTMSVYMEADIIASGTEYKINRKATRVGTFEVCVPTYVALHMHIMQVLASQLPFLANRNAELAIPPLFWPVNCIKIGEHVALLSGPTVYYLFCGSGEMEFYLCSDCVEVNQ